MTHTRLKASVLIVEYSTRQYLVECLASLEKSDYPRDAFEVIVVDNASSTPVDPLIDSFPRIRFVKSKRNLGFAGGNNLGIQQALDDGAAWVLLINNDTAEDHGTDDGILDICRNPVDQCDRVFQNLHDCGPNHHADNRALTAAQTTAAEHRRSNGV